MAMLQRNGDKENVHGATDISACAPLTSNETFFCGKDWTVAAELFSRQT